MLTFESFDLESANRCRYDYVEINGEKYCGSSKPSPVISSGNTLTITFHSDYSVIRSGFKATWKAMGNTGISSIRKQDGRQLLWLLSNN